MQYEIKQFAPVLPNLGNDLLNTYIYSRDRREAQQAANAQAEQTRMVQAQAEAQARAKAEAEAADKAMLDEAFMKVRENPSLENRANILNLQTRMNPTAGKEMRENFAAMDEAKQQQILKEGSEIVGALELDPEVGISILERLAQANETAGDNVSVQMYRKMIAKAKESPDGARAVQDYYLKIMNGIPGGDKIIEGVTKIGQERRAEDSAPAALRKMLAEAGLSEAKINETLANTGKLEAETRKILAELEAKKAQDLYTPEDAAAAEDALRKEFDGKQKTFRQINDFYNVINSAETTGIGDLALIFTYMKMLDPTSTVREGEQASTANAGGVPSGIMSAYNRAIGTGKIDDKVRNEIRSQSKKIYNNAEAQKKIEEAFYTKIAKDRGLKVDMIINTAPAQETTGMSSTANVQGAPAGVGKAVPGTSATVKQPVVTGDF
jgi:hypothetical protein